MIVPTRLFRKRVHNFCDASFFSGYQSNSFKEGQTKYPPSVSELNLKFPFNTSPSHFGEELLRTSIDRKQRTIYISLVLRIFYCSLCESTEQLDNGDDALRCSLRNSQLLAYLLTIAQSRIPQRRNIHSQPSCLNCKHIRACEI